MLTHIHHVVLLVIADCNTVLYFMHVILTFFNQVYMFKHDSFHLLNSNLLALYCCYSLSWLNLVWSLQHHVLLNMFID
jgi:hypothetical protein